jgi:hypothetical protein
MMIINHHYVRVKLSSNFLLIVVTEDEHHPRYFEKWGLDH